jgi:hypothetical protein
MKSRIHKLSLEINFETGLEIEDTTRQARRIYNEQVLRALDDVIDEAAQEDKEVFIKKIELDLGKIEESGLENKLKLLLSEKLREQMKDLQNQDIPRENPPFFVASESSPNVLDNYFINYLIKGTLPFNMHELLATEKAFLINWISEAFSESSGIRAVKIASLLSDYPTAVQRLLLNSDNRTFKLVVASFTGNLPDETGRKIEVAFRSVLAKRFRTRGDAATIVQRMAEILLLSRVSPAGEELKERIDQLTIKIKHSFDKKISLNNQAGLPAEELRPLFIPADDHIPVPNAGIVLLCPFLPGLFANLELTDPGTGNFKDIRCRHRAMHLLQVVTGQKGQHFDFLLPLNKIICGIDPYSASNPIFRSVSRERKEIRMMLKELLRQWDSLKTRSIKGIQQLFLVRNGIVENSDTGWILHVENAAYDILLDRLPWGISALKFPWNNFVIYVDWKH